MTTARIARSDFLAQLAVLGTFNRNDARTLWDGDTAFQCVWYHLIRIGELERIERIQRGCATQGYLWRVKQGGDVVTARKIEQLAR